MFRAYNRPRYQVSVYRTTGPLECSVVCSLSVHNFKKSFTKTLQNLKSDDLETWPCSSGT